MTIICQKFINQYTKKEKWKIKHIKRNNILSKPSKANRGIQISFLLCTVDSKNPLQRSLVLLLTQGVSKPTIKKLIWKSMTPQKSTGNRR